ncbi:hydroxypyruvate isomerase [Pseudoduganella sp. FT25W]|uniref:Hydroxypyruvate isomerase n=1 Tax=Duganella alba TaxID=2666081 RepID=A0A6L5QI07_9BURK|nr:hydroxypyruvate isomerase [Duganella alba]MRX08922.1 hydroxypyruvate isomerase [Duganella alba]MRX19032.1 hydroxypyruvate isomerase [Duganella alba]
MPKFAANLSMLYTDTPFLDRFALAHAAGFEGVEFLFPYAFDTEQIAERLRRYQLKLVLFNLPAGDWNAGDRGIACDPRRVDEFRAGVASALEYAGELGVTQVHCMAGKIPGGLAPELARATYLDNLRYAAQQLQPAGINVLIEPINHYDMPGYLLTHSSQALQIIAEAACPNIFLQYDIYHMQRMEGELSNTIQANLPFIKHMQIADTPGRHEPGTGEINYRHLFAFIDQLGYDGWLGCEYIPAGDTNAGLGWREALTT